MTRQSAAAVLGLELQALAREFMLVGVCVQMFVRGGKVSITKLEVIDPRDQGQGLARQVMTEVCAWADEQGHALGVSPDGRWGADVARLTRFYASFGFEPNPEQQLPFRAMDDMVRYPRERRGEVTSDASQGLLQRCDSSCRTTESG